MKLYQVAAAIAAVAVGLACSVALDNVKPPSPVYDSCTQVIYGACVVYDRGAQPLTTARLEEMFRSAADHWGTKPEAIAGYTVVVKGRDPYVLGDDWIWGVTIFEMKRLDFAVPVPLCPDLIFMHEWGHAGADVLEHEDPRFEDSAIRDTLVFLGRTECRA